MIEFPAAELVLGSDQPADRAQPPHEVAVDAFSLADRCVSAADFLAFLQAGPDQLAHTLIDCIDPCFIVHRATGFELRPGCGDFPMIQLGFWGAASYCNWLSRLDGRVEVYDLVDRSMQPAADGYRLPTEAEWECACRTGRSAELLDVNSADAGPNCRALRANASSAGNFQPDLPGPVPVAGLPADAAGLYQMLGNVREWCQDRFGPYPASRQHNPGGPTRGAFRVVRGGSFLDDRQSIGPAVRLAAFEDTRCEVYGFRVARSQ
ncbi:MAG TPA: SUMF1/EgtB/PvdO family nonheme iron enzyme [Jatrophihabitans sp.]|nr:SUMF1/EgtB/PvdO family nonheme iron enzyme [Jatrophihabitans sp.]